MLRRLPTHDTLQCKGLLLVSQCYLCHCNVETTDHLLWTCPFSQLVLTPLLQRLCGHVLIASSLIEASNLLLNSFQRRSWTKTQQQHIGRIFCAVIACIWNERNSRCFDNSQPIHALKELCYEISSYFTGMEG